MFQASQYSQAPPMHPLVLCGPAAQSGAEVFLSCLGSACPISISLHLLCPLEMGSPGLPGCLPCSRVYPLHSGFPQSPRPHLLSLLMVIDVLLVCFYFGRWFYSGELATPRNAAPDFSAGVSVSWVNPTSRASSRKGLR